MAIHVVSVPIECLSRLPPTKNGGWVICKLPAGSRVLSAGPDLQGFRYEVCYETPGEVPATYSIGVDPMSDKGTDTI